jgi:hypothetical protein
MPRERYPIWVIRAKDPLTKAPPNNWERIDHSEKERIQQHIKRIPTSMPS